MKKTVVAFGLCLLLLCIAACSNKTQNSDTKRFESSEELLNYLEGMWVVENDNEQKSFYIFQDGQLYITTDATYSAQVKKTLDSALQNGGLDALCMQDFENVSGRMYLSDISITPDPVTLFPQDGEIKLYDGKYDEQSIVISEESVLLVPKGADSGTAMTKLSDTADFSAEHFEELFNQVLDSYEIPSKRFLIDTAEYGEIIKSTISNFNWWDLIWSDDEVQAYTPNEALTPIKGSKLAITKETLTYVYITSVSTGFIGNDHKETRLITYSPEDGNFNIMDVNTNSDWLSMMAYGLCAVQNIPGAYTDVTQLYNDIKTLGTTTDSTITMRSGAIVYSLLSDEDEIVRTFEIQVDDTVSLRAILDIAEENKNYAPLQSGTLDQLLDGSKSWVGKWKYDGWEYSVFFVFKEDGTCYWALGDSELFGAGVGTYSIQDGNTLQLELMELGKKHTDIYTFDPDTFSLTIFSAESFAVEKGEVLYLQENTEIDTEQIENWGNLYSEASIGSEEWE